MGKGTVKLSDVDAPASQFAAHDPYSECVNDWNTYRAQGTRFGIRTTPSMSQVITNASSSLEQFRHSDGQRER